MDEEKGDEEMVREGDVFLNYGRNNIYRCIFGKKGMQDTSTKSRQYTT